MPESLKLLIYSNAIILMVGLVLGGVVAHFNKWTTSQQIVMTLLPAVGLLFLFNGLLMFTG